MTPFDCRRVNKPHTWRRRSRPKTLVLAELMAEHVALKKATVYHSFDPSKCGMMRIAYRNHGLDCSLRRREGGIANVPLPSYRPNHRGPRQSAEKVEIELATMQRALILLTGRKLNSATTWDGFALHHPSLLCERRPYGQTMCYIQIPSDLPRGWLRDSTSLRRRYCWTAMRAPEGVEEPL